MDLIWIFPWYFILEFQKITKQFGMNKQLFNSEDKSEWLMYLFPLVHKMGLCNNL